MTAKKTRAHRWLPGIATAALLSAVASAAAAPPAAAAGHSPAAISAGQPPGYQVVSSGPVNAPPGASSSGAFATCPAGTVAWGGGVAFDSSPGAGLTVNTSSPNGSGGWEGWVNNTGAATAQFSADAICADKPAGYKIVSDSHSVPPGGLLEDGLGCPTGTSALDGGAQVPSHVPSVQIVDSINQGGTAGWFIALGNTGRSAKQADGYVICAA